MVTWHDEIGQVTCLPSQPRCIFQQSPTGQCCVLGHIKHIKQCQWWTAPIIFMKKIAYFWHLKKQVTNCRTDGRTDTPSYRGAKTHLINVDWIYWRSLSLRSSVSSSSSRSTLVRDKSNLRKQLTPVTQQRFLPCRRPVFSPPLRHHPTTLKKSRTAPRQFHPCRWDMTRWLLFSLDHSWVHLYLPLIHSSLIL